MGRGASTIGRAAAAFALSTLTVALLVRCASFGASDAAAPDGSDRSDDDGTTPTPDAGAGDGSPCVGDAHYFCLDFDDGRTASAIFGSASGLAVVVDADAAVSPPGSLLATTSPGNDTLGEKVFTDAVSRFTLTLQHRRESYDGLVSTAPVGVGAQGALGDVSCYVVFSPSDGSLNQIFAPADGGAQERVSAVARNDIALPKGEWGSLTLDVYLQDASPRCELSIDGQFKSSLAIPAAIVPTQWSIGVGANTSIFSSDAGAATIRYDNVVVDVVP